MAKSASTEFSNPYSEVEIQPVHVAGEEVNKIAVRVKNDEGQYQLAGILGKEYNLIKNSIAKDIVSDIQTRSGYSWKGLKTHWDGKKFIDYSYTENPIFDIDNRYPIHLGLMARNSYDGSSVFGIEFYAMNLVCLNQFISRKLMGFFAIRHSGTESFDIDDALMSVSQGSKRLIELAPRYQMLTQKELSTSDIIEAKRAELIPDSKWGEAIDQLGKEQDAGKLFGLYQALTFVTSHKMNGLNALNYGNQITEHFLKNV